jgi:hypothetical protein
LRRTNSKETLGFAITTDSKITGTVAARWWIAEQDAVRIASAARLLAGADPDLSTARDAVTQSATAAGATLTPDDVAIERAAASMARLDAMIEAMRGGGTLREFNRQYKLRRAAARAEGRGFMLYAVAVKRLKLALVPMLQSGRPLAGVFDEVFR